MPLPARHPRTWCAPCARRAQRLLSVALAATVAVVAGSAHAAAPSDCHVVVEHADGLLERRATVGEVDRRTVPALRRLLNRGPHDVRATFDRLDPLVLQRGQAEPAHGRLSGPVRLISLECLPGRAAATAADTGPLPLLRHAVGRVAAIPPLRTGRQPWTP